MELGWLGVGAEKEWLGEILKDNINDMEGWLW